MARWIRGSSSKTNDDMSRENSARIARLLQVARKLQLAQDMRVTESSF